MKINVLSLGGSAIPVLVHCMKPLSLCFVDDCPYMARNIKIVSGQEPYGGMIF